MHPVLMRCFLLLLALLCGLGVAQAVTPMVAAGNNHSLFLKNDGTVLTVGSDAHGKLGVGRLVYSAMPLQVTGLTPIRKIFGAVSGWGTHSMALDEDGVLWAWGSNSSGQLGDGTTIDRSTPVRVTNLTGVSNAAAGGSHSLALKQDGTVWAWGANYGGQLGDGTTTWRSTPVQVANLNNVIAIEAGGSHSFAIKQDGTVWAWGYNGDAQLGDGSTTNRSKPVQIANLANVTTILGGQDYSTALKQDGTVWTWGKNDRGQLADGSNASVIRSTPAPATALSNVTAIATSGMKGIALKHDGTVWTWADGQVGQANPPKQVQGHSDVVAVAASVNHYLLLKRNGTVWAWGWNGMGELGNGTTDGGNGMPTQVLNLTNVTAISVGGYHSIALRGDGSVWTWGRNDLSQLGTGEFPLSSAPVKPLNISNIVAVAAGVERSVALKQDGTVWSWGVNFCGQLGANPGINSSTPLQAVNLTNVTAIAAGYHHSVALRQDGSIWAWGCPNHGAIGDGATDARETPVQIPNITGVTAISARVDHNLALKQDGTLWAWGDNFGGQLGDGTKTDRASPVQIGTNFRTIATGNSHSIGIKNDNTLWAWGSNGAGQLGDGSWSDHLIPVQVGSGYSVIAAGDFHNLALKPDGTLWAWGSNNYGQLGDGTKNNSPIPKQIGSGFLAIAAGGGYSLALKTDGTVRAWGHNDSGQLGDGTLAEHQSPVLVANEAVNGPLDLIPEVPNNIPADKIPPFWAKVTKAAQVSTSINYNAADVGKNGRVFIVAHLKRNSPLLASASPAPDTDKNNAHALNPSGDDITCAVLTRSSWKQQSDCNITDSLQSGTLDNGKSYDVYEAGKFDNTKDTGTFYVVTTVESAKGQEVKIVTAVTGVDSMNQPTAFQFPQVPITTTPPSCSLNAPASINAGDSVTLSASCSPQASSYTWSGGGCAGAGSSCTDTPSNTTTYSVTGSNADGMGNTASATVTVNLPPQPVCSLTANPVVIAAGAGVTLSAHCNPAATSYAWGSSGFGSGTSSGTVFPTAPTLYSVTGSNAAGSGNTATAEVYVCNTAPSGNVPGLSLNGTTGNDPLASGMGNDAINGLGGVDTVVYNCNRSNFVITKTANGWTVSSKAEGLDTLTNVERIRFGDTTLALDISGNAGQAYRIYQAAFNRTPDAGGLKYWIAQMDQGMNQQEVAARFVDSAEFRTLYGSNPSNAEFLTKLYSNVLHRTPDQTGYNWWLGELNAGRYNKVSALASFAESPENQAGVLQAILNGIDVMN